MRPLMILLFLASIPPAMAQDVSVPAVTTASPGGYANPLKLDTDRYNQQKGKSARPSTPTPSGRCNGKPMTASQRASLEAGYRTRATNGRDQQGWRWLRDQCGATTAMQIQRTAKRRAPGR